MDIGGTLKVGRNFYMYAGGGYGLRQKFWETIDGKWVLNQDLSVKGVAVSAGTIVRYKLFSAQIGVRSIQLKDFSLTLGVGLSL